LHYQESKLGEAVACQRRERERMPIPDSDIFVFEIQKNDISVVPSVSDFILSERGEIKRSPKKTRC